MSLTLYFSSLMCITFDQLNYIAVDGWDSNLFFIAIDSDHSSIESPTCPLYNKIFNSVLISHCPQQKIFSDTLFLSERELDTFFNELVIEEGDSDDQQQYIMRTLIGKFIKYGFKNRGSAVESLNVLLELTPKEKTPPGGESTPSVFVHVIYGMVDHDIIFLYTAFVRRPCHGDLSHDCITVLEFPGTCFPFKFIGDELKFLQCEGERCSMGFCDRIKGFTYSGEEEIRI